MQASITFATAPLGSPPWTCGNVRKNLHTRPLWLLPKRRKRLSHAATAAAAAITMRNLSFVAALVEPMQWNTHRAAYLSWCAREANKSIG